MTLSLTNVTKRFGPTVAVRSVSWAPQRGQVTALVGLNGAGKSTLMRLITGLVRPTDGAVAVTGALSAMIEAPALFGGLSVRRNLRIHRVLTGAGPAAIAAVAELAQIEPVLRQRVGTLSQGYRQRVAIAVAMLRSPAVLLLDEPTNTLDPEAIVHLRGLIRRLADTGTAVVVSTHLLRELEGTADALAVMHEGRLLYDGPFAAFVGPGGLRVRTADQGETGRLVELLRAKGIDAEHGAHDLRTPPGDERARDIFAVAAAAGITLVELAHLTPTLEEAFQTTISGVR